LQKKDLLHKDIFERLQREVLDAFGDSKDLEYEKVISLPYLDAFIKEVLRLYTVVAGGYRKTTKELVYNDIIIPKGSKLLYNVPSNHLNEQVYENPDRFDPWTRNLTKDP